MIAIDLRPTFTVLSTAKVTSTRSKNLELKAFSNIVLKALDLLTYIVPKILDNIRL